MCRFHDKYYSNCESRINIARTRYSNATTDDQFNAAAMEFIGAFVNSHVLGPNEMRQLVSVLPPILSKIDAWSVADILLGAAKQEVINKTGCQYSGYSYDWRGNYEYSCCDREKSGISAYCQAFEAMKAYFQRRKAIDSHKDMIRRNSEAEMNEVKAMLAEALGEIRRLQQKSVSDRPANAHAVNAIFDKHLNGKR